VMSVKVGRVIAGKYRLERPLAKGGMGSVWIGRHLLLDVAVAVKFMDPAFAEHGELRARFDREAKASAQMKSPHVVQVHDYGFDADTAFLVMELLEGEDLATRLARVGRLPLPAASAILTQACKGLRRAHELGIVHRDLKPGNIFLARHDDEEIVKVLDFGIAKVIGPAASGSATATGSLIGSPLYMSPEQIRRSKEVDFRSDLWALGVILYECITGCVPFNGQEVGDILVAICTDPVRPPSRLAPFLPPEVDRFFERALARDPAGRFQSAREMAEAFAALAGVRASGADWSGHRVSDPPAVGSVPPYPRAATEVMSPNPIGMTPNPGRPQGRSAVTGDATFAPAGRSVAEPARRGTPVAAVLIATVGTLLVLGLGGVFVARWLTGSSAAEPPAPEAAQPAAEGTSLPSGASAPIITPAAEAPQTASASAPPASATSASPVASAPVSSWSGRRAQPPPAKTSTIFGF
jgi:eukaryotic-like serine/threonine-protein kinase